MDLDIFDSIVTSMLIFLFVLICMMRLVGYKKEASYLGAIATFISIIMQSLTLANAEFGFMSILLFIFFSLTLWYSLTYLGGCLLDKKKQNKTESEE